MISLNNFKPIALTAGEPSSIAAELLFKSWLELKKKHILCFFSINNVDYLNTIKDTLGYKINLEKISKPEEACLVFKNKIPVIDIPLIDKKSSNLLNSKVVLGKPNVNYVPFIINSLDKAIEYAKNGLVNAITTMPIEKYVMNQGNFQFIGHTEYLAYKSNTKKSVMLMASPYSKLKVVPLYTHISLKNSIEILSQEDITETIKIINSDLTKYLNHPIKFLVLGLNPHAGERGLMGKEEISIIKPAIKKLQEEGLCIKGPVPSDTAFNKSNIDNFDIILGMNHDQVLAPFKALLFDEGVNVTLGLPFLRTSPDHGTALDIAAKNIANPKSIISAILLANMWQKSKLYNG